MLNKLVRVCGVLLVLGCFEIVIAATVTIDPGLYRGDYNAGTGWIRNGAVQVFTYPNGTRQTVTVGGSYPNEIFFDIDAGGNISSTSSRIDVVGNTIHFHTVPVDVDPGLYTGRYNVLGYRSGFHTLHFVPGGTGSDDFGSHYAIGNGAWPWSTGFDLDPSGNVSSSSTRIIASGNSITFVTVPTVIDPGLFTGRYNGGGLYTQGVQTIHLMPEGTGADDFGSRWTIGNGAWPWGIGYDLDTVGNVSTDSTRVSVSGNTITFITVPIVIDPGLYAGRYNGPTGYLSGGPHTMHLLPEGTGTMDLGSRWTIGNGEWPFGIGFDVDLVGNVVSDSSRLTVSGNTMTFNTIPIDVDPGSYSGNYSIGGANYNGVQEVHLMQEGTGTMDLGARWSLFIPGVGSGPFDIDNPCAIIPGEIISVGSGVQAVDFNVTCGSVIVDTDEDGVADSSDNCPAIPNPDQLDQDGDDIGNVCDDDLDGDGVLNAADNCPDLANSGQSDLDMDGIGDDCDDDVDGDSIPDASDNCPITPNTDQANGDGDSQGDACDPDDDNDGYMDATDNCPNTANPDQLDTDVDGEGDACDGDVDGDSVGNEADSCAATPAGVPITDDGCSAQQWVDLNCIEGAFPNHGRYVSCVAHIAKDLVDMGLISAKEKSRFVTQAARK